MATIILYRSRHGCAEKAAFQLQKLIEDDLVNVVNLRKTPYPDISLFKTVILGGSIHIGKIQKEIPRFCRKNYDLLMMKRLGLFLCCMEENEKAEIQFNEAFPEQLKEKAVAKGMFGGELILSKMNFIDKWMMRKFGKVTENISTVNQKAIAEFAGKMTYKR
jgi:menaquinone-dependent protoporphyrinogen oxidase